MIEAKPQNWTGRPEDLPAVVNEETARTALENTTVAITGLVDEPLTTPDTLPTELYDRLPIQLVQRETVNEARNAAVKRSDTDRIILFRDGIRFPAVLIGLIATEIDFTTLITSWNYGFGFIDDTILGFHTELFDDIGGFTTQFDPEFAAWEFGLKYTRSSHTIVRYPTELFDMPDTGQSAESRLGHNPTNGATNRQLIRLGMRNPIKIAHILEFMDL